MALKEVAVTVPLPVGGAYAAGDVVGSSFPIPYASRAAGVPVVLTSVTLIDAAAQRSLLNLVLFSEELSSTAPVDNAAWAIVAKDAAKARKTLKLATATADYTTYVSGVVAIADLSNINFLITPTRGPNLYGQLYIPATSTPTFTQNSGVLTLLFGFSTYSPIAAL